MELGAAVTQNIYDNLDSSTLGSQKDYNEYQVASMYRWKNKRVHSRVLLSDAPIAGVSDHFELQTDVYFGIKASRQLELGAQLGYDYKRYALRDIKNRESKLGLGIEANFIL